jgi:N-acetylneuraminic acid mutarotase
MSMRSTITNVFIALALADAWLPAAGQTDLTRKPAPEVTHDAWTSGTPMPTPVWAPGGVGVVKGEIYVVGGATAPGDIVADTQIYNPVTNTWRTGLSLPTPLLAGAGAVVKNILYIIGGTTDGTTATNAVWAFNPKTKMWSAKSPMPTARNSIGAVVHNNIIYVSGGNVGSERLNTEESYNPATDTWTEEAPLLVGKSEPTVGFVSKMIVVADGYTASGNTGDNEGYNPLTNTWKTFKSDPTPRNTACGAGIGAKLYVAGGEPGGGAGTPAYDLNESFQVSKNAWTTLAAMPQASMFGGSAVYKGKLYCIGGTSTYEGATLNNVQIYQP